MLAAVEMPNESTDIAQELRAVLDNQRKAYFANPEPSYKQRVEDLKKLQSLLADNIDELVDAINTDYCNRSRHETLFAEFMAGGDSIKHSIKHLKKWMKTQKRAIDLTLFFGAKNYVKPQPLGVVGLIIPWNFPINLIFSQLAGAFAAGNRAMVKMSENSMALAAVLKRLSKEYFPEDKLCFFIESGGVGIEFSKLPFDLIVFTGSGQTGRAVMASAAQNLTPVILELGGKAPAVIDPNYDLDKAVERIMYVKQMNAGQICTNVDYVFVHESQREAFIAKAKAYAQKHLPDITSKDYTSIIDQRSLQRLINTIDDAKQKGATVINLCEGQEPNHELRKLPLHLILDTTADMTIRQRETFGPLLLVLTYQEPSEVINYVNAGDRPLALYPFTNDSRLAEHYITHIMSGGVSINDALFHVAQHDLPFGGVGASGMGHYHGYEGFVAFSKMRPIFRQAKSNAMGLLRPPYSDFATKAINMLVKMKLK